MHSINFEKYKTTRIPLDQVIGHLASDYLDRKELITIKRDKDSKITKEILSQFSYPFNFESSRQYNMLTEGIFGVTHENKLFIGRNWALIGNAFYSKGKAKNAKFVYRLENTLTFGFLKEEFYLDESINIKHSKKQYQISSKISNNYRIIDIIHKPLSNLNLRQILESSTHDKLEYFGLALLGKNLK